MAVVKTSESSRNANELFDKGFNKMEFQCNSTDAKPSLTKNNSGSTFLELDTGKVYIWHINSWVELA